MEQEGPRGALGVQRRVGTDTDSQTQALREAEGKQARVPAGWGRSETQGAALRLL